MADKLYPQHVLMTADAVGGVWTYSLELARALAARGVRVSFATMGRLPSEAQRDEVRRIPNTDLHESGFALEWEDDPWTDVDDAADWLLDTADRIRPDLIHVNGYAHTPLRWNAPVLCAAHSCVSSWWRAVHREDAPARYAEYRRRVREGLFAADQVVAPSHAMVNCLRAEYAFPGDACAIANGRDAAIFRPAAKQKYILTSGRLWDEAKNVGALDAVAASLPWPVRVAGSGDHPNGSREQFANLQPLGQLSTAQMAELFAHAPVYVLPARYEPFGLSALEAALSGCALVLGDIPSLREVWGDAALYVHPDDHACLSDTLERVIRSSSLREDLASRARLRARRFSPERMAMGYMDAYRRAAATFVSRRKAAA